MNNALAAEKISERIVLLKESYGDRVSIDDVGDIVENLVDGMSSEFTSEQNHVKAELKNLVDYIEKAKEGIVSIRPKTLSARDIPGATDELDAVVDATEEAAGKIMDAADELNVIAEKADDKIAEKLMDLSTRIFEASSFQDITGQRVNKVVTVLRLLEEKLAALADTIGDTEVDAKTDIEYTKEGDIIDDKALLHGPQLEGDGNSQDDIDALLASFD